MKRIALWSVAIMLAVPWIAHACPGCSEALFDPAQGAARVGSLRGYLVSIVVLLGVPALMIGGVALAVMRASQRLRPRPAESTSRPPRLWPGTGRGGGRARAIVDTHKT